MNDIFQDFIMEGHVCVYMEDILIFTNTLEKHQHLLWIVLKHLQQHQLYLCSEKCEFEQTKVEYLRLIVLYGKVEMDPVKVAGVMDWPTPANWKEVQAFLGFANSYHQFIKGFLHHACPLFELTKKEVKWSWGESKQQAFNRLKWQFTSTPILCFADNDLPYHVEADSSYVATGAVLLQQLPDDNQWHAVTFYSKSLTLVEQNYEIHDKEMLAIIHALEEWKHFLEGTKHCIEIWTDYKNLEYFWTVKKLDHH